MNPNTWCPEDGQLLQMLRTQAAIDSHVFARSNTLSFAQLQELESGIGNCFYSDLIKRNAGIKLLKKLGHEMQAPTQEEVQNTVESLAPFLPTQAQSPSLLQTSVAQLATNSTRSPTSKRRPINPMIWVIGILIMGLLGVLNFQSQVPAQAIPRGTHLSEANPAIGTPLVGLNTESPPAVAVPIDPETPPKLVRLAPPVSLANPASDRIQLASVSCEDKHRNNSQSHTPSNPLKPGNYIFIEARADSELCVLDSDNKLSTLSLKAGMTQKVNGLAPFLLHTSNWQGVQVFFQGRPVQTDHGDSAHLVLNSLPL